jgi:hypothetical protein
MRPSAPSSTATTTDVPASDFDAAVESHAAQYEQVAAALALLMAQAATAAEPTAIPQARAAARRYLDALLQAATAWIRTNTPAVYRQGVSEARGSVVEAVQGREHSEVLRGLAEAIAADLGRAVEEMGRDFDRGLAEIRRRRIAEALDTRNAPESAANMAREMRNRDIRYTDRLGRRWNPRHYAATCLYTHVATTLNASTALTSARIGSPGVVIADGGPGDVDEPCRKANGQRWSVMYWLAHLIEHPRCRRAGTPLSPRWTGVLDRVMPGERREVGVVA